MADHEQQPTPAERLPQHHLIASSSQSSTVGSVASSSGGGSNDASSKSSTLLMHNHKYGTSARLHRPPKLPPRYPAVVSTTTTPEQYPTTTTINSSPPRSRSRRQDLPQPSPSSSVSSSSSPPPRNHHQVSPPRPLSSFPRNHQPPTVPSPPRVDYAQPRPIDNHNNPYRHLYSRSSNASRSSSNASSDTETKRFNPFLACATSSKDEGDDDDDDDACENGAAWTLGFATASNNKKLQPLSWTDSLQNEQRSKQQPHRHEHRKPSPQSKPASNPIVILLDDTNDDIASTASSRDHVVRYVSSSSLKSLEAPDGLLRPQGIPPIKSPQLQQRRRVPRFLHICILVWSGILVLSTGTVVGAYVWRAYLLQQQQDPKPDDISDINDNYSIRPLFPTVSPATTFVPTPFAADLVFTFAPTPSATTTAPSVSTSPSVLPPPVWRRSPSTPPPTHTPPPSFGAVGDCVDTDLQFVVSTSLGPQGCDFLLSLPAEERDRLCFQRQIQAHLYCPKTCGFCIERESASPTEGTPTTAAPMTAAPTTGAPTPMPTVLPTLVPAIIADIEQTLVPCNNTGESQRGVVIYADGNGLQQTCGWLASQEDDMRVRQCRPQHSAWYECPQTCGRCAPAAPATLPPTPMFNGDEVFEEEVVKGLPQHCPEESPSTTIFVNAQWGQQSCEWLGGRPGHRNRLCQPHEAAWEACPQTCGKCEATVPNDGMAHPCPEDSQNITVFVNAQWGEQPCAWLAGRPGHKNRLCQPNEAGWQACPQTCGKCGNSPE